MGKEAVPKQKSKNTPIVSANTSNIDSSRFELLNQTPGSSGMSSSGSTP